MESIYKCLNPFVFFLRRVERYIKIYVRGLKKKNPKTTFYIGKYFTLGKLVMASLVAVAIFYSLGMRIGTETLVWLQQDLFFKPLGLIVPLLLATAMFAVPQRIPFETLATVGLSVISTYLVTTMISSTMGYQSVILFDTSQYIKPLLSPEIQGEPSEFRTDFTLLYIIVFSLLLSLLITKLVKKHRGLREQVVFLSLFFEKLSYRVLGVILWMMPLAVFASIMLALQMHGVEKLASLGWFVLFTNVPQFFYILILITMLKFGSGVSFSFAAAAIKSLAKVAIPSGSSAATLLTNVATARKFPIIERYKNKGFIASILPFGSTVNMDGTALFITIMCKIGADIQGLDVGYWDIIPYAVAYSCAAAAVPSASIVLITAIFKIIGIDDSITVQILGLMIAVDWINDRVRTLVNVSGDLTAIILSLNERSPLQIFVKIFGFHKK